MQNLIKEKELTAAVHPETANLEPTNCAATCKTKAHVKTYTCLSHDQDWTVHTLLINHPTPFTLLCSLRYLEQTMHFSN